MSLPTHIHAPGSKVRLITDFDELLGPDFGYRVQMVQFDVYGRVSYYVAGRWVPAHQGAPIEGEPILRLTPFESP